MPSQRATLTGAVVLVVAAALVWGARDLDRRQQAEIQSIQDKTAAYRKLADARVAAASAAAQAAADASASAAARADARAAARAPGKMQARALRHAETSATINSGRREL